MSTPPKESWRWTFIVLPSLHPCTICGVHTRFCWPDFEVPCHPGICEETLWTQYVTALRATD